MKEIPILYSTPMILAKLAGRKTVTRRPVKPQLEPCNHSRYTEALWKNKPTELIGKDGYWYCKYCGNGSGYKSGIKCPYGQPGDIVYARENYYQKGYWIKDGLTKKGNQKWKFVNTDRIVLYENNKPENYRKSRDKKNPSKIHWYKRLGRFMPKGYARIYERVISVRPERLQDITEEDAAREGVEKRPNSDNRTRFDYKHYEWGTYDVSAVVSFRTLWQSIHGPESWNPDLWVWRIETEVLSTTGRPAKM